MGYSVLCSMLWFCRILCPTMQCAQHATEYIVYYVAHFDSQQVNPCKTFAYYAQMHTTFYFFILNALCQEMTHISLSFWCAQTSRRLGQREWPSPAEDQSGPPLPASSGHSGTIGPQRLQVTLAHLNFTRSVKSKGAVDFSLVWARCGPRVLKY